MVKQTFPSSKRVFEEGDKLWVLGHRDSVDKLIHRKISAPHDLNLPGTTI